MRADEEYAAGHYAEAFAALETFMALPGEDAAGAQDLIEQMERRFADDLCEAAKETLGGERDKLEAAIAQLDDALAIRPLKAIETYRDHLSEYLPLNLTEAEFSEKEGAVFRNTGEFEALNGKTYTEGWIWGENEAALSFALDGAYDLLECKFVTSRDDEEDGVKPLRRSRRRVGLARSGSGEARGGSVRRGRRRRRRRRGARCAGDDSAV